MLDPATATTLIEDRWGHFADLLDGLDPGGWDQPTRLPGWNVSDLASHVSWGIAMEADALAKMRAGEAEPAAADAIPASAGPSELIDGIRRRTAELVGALRRTTPNEMSQTVPMPYGPTPLPFVVQVFSMEAAIHTDDLADALDRDEALSEDSIAATMMVMGASLPLLGQATAAEADEGAGYHVSAPGVELAVARREGAWAVGDPGDRTTTIEGDAAVVTRFVMGRIPLADAPLTIGGNGLEAKMFKRYFPGP